jgi:thiol-disulfide isomerase/thioredoxin
MIIILLVTISFFGFGQNYDPVSWKFSSEKIDALTYKVKFVATVEDPFHIYPQNSEVEDGLGMPTEFLFAEDPNIEIIGGMEERGVQQSDGEKLPYYKKGATFTQSLKLKSDKQTTVSFTIKYIACTNLMCLPPSSKRFTLVLSDGNTNAIIQNILSDEINKQESLVKYEDFAMPDTLGRVISSRAITSKAKYTYIDFWASWCIPCRAQGRELIPIYNKYKTAGFNVIGVSLDTKPLAWKKAIRADGYSWTNVSDLKGYESAMIIKYGFTSIPRSFLVDSKGNMVAMDLHGKELDEKLSELLR